MATIVVNHPWRWMRSGTHRSFFVVSRAPRAKNMERSSLSGKSSLEFGSAMVPLRLKRSSLSMK